MHLFGLCVVLMYTALSYREMKMANFKQVFLGENDSLNVGATGTLHIQTPSLIELI